MERLGLALGGDEVAAGSEPEMNRPRRLGRLVGEIDIERLHEGLEHARRHGLHSCAPFRDQLRLSREVAWIGDPAVCMRGDPLKALASRSSDQDRHPSGYGPCVLACDIAPLLRWPSDIWARSAPARAMTMVNSSESELKRDVAEATPMGAALSAA